MGLIGPKGHSLQTSVRKRTYVSQYSYFPPKQDSHLKKL